MGGGGRDILQNIEQNRFIIQLDVVYLESRKTCL